MECTCHAAPLCTHSFALPQTGRQAALENKTVVSLSLCAHLCQVFMDAGNATGKKKKVPEREKTPLAVLHVYVLESTCMCLCLSSPLPTHLHSASFISTNKMFVLHRNMSAEHVQAHTSWTKNKQDAPT